ncbi:MAG: Na/Pi cotransporter family protein [Spirochaetes bacterium]|nr:Na/Pi cotransporter family protein [Spirochaetota bacterium]MBU0954046.1 Na/Pi cotransporter family protein [Spirochaetota bacterium]
MSIYSILDLIGGLAIFLFGMTMMNNNLTALAGSRLRSIMLSLTKTKLRGYLTGVGITIVNQSSSATTVLEAVLVGAGLMTFQQSLAVTLGAELGSTFLGQLFAFPKITGFAPLFVAIGFFGFLLSRNKRYKNITQSIMGFGLLFLGMNLMSDSMQPLRSSATFMALMARVEQPALGILIGLLFTMIVQSSGATTGLVIAMAMAGTINLAQAVPINLGASIGTCITAILGSLSLNREAKRSAYIHVVFQSIGVLLAWLLLMIPFRGDRLYLFLAKAVTQLITGSQDNLARQIAMAHTLMPVLNHLIIFPLLPLLVKGFNRLVPPAPPSEEFGPRYLGESMLNEPEVALYQVKQELLRMGPIIEKMLDESMQMFISHDLSAAKNIKREDSMIDTLRREIILYLAKIAQRDINADQSRLQVAYLFITTELENLADVIERNILDRAKKLMNKNRHFSKEGLEEVRQLEEIIAVNFHSVMESFETENTIKARETLANAESCWELQQEYRHRHFKRLNRGVIVSIETTEIHMDLLNHFNRINRHIYHIAQALIDLEEKNSFNDKI